MMSIQEELEQIAIDAARLEINEHCLRRDYPHDASNRAEGYATKMLIVDTLQLAIGALEAKLTDPRHLQQNQVRYECMNDIQRLSTN